MVNSTHMERAEPAWIFPFPDAFPRLEPSAQSKVSNRFLLPLGDNISRGTRATTQHSLTLYLIFMSDPSRGAQKSSTPKSKCCIKAHFKLFFRNKVTFRSAVSTCCATFQKSPRNDSPGPKNLPVLPCTGRKSSWDKVIQPMNYNPNPDTPWRGGLKMGWLRKRWKWV